MKKILQKLVSYNTIASDKKTNQRLLMWIKKQLPKKMYVKIINNNLIATTQNTKTPHLWLCAHIDIVPGDCKLKIKNNKAYGRGVYDMKFAIVCYLRLIKELKNLKKYNFGIMLTSDEETGGFQGTKLLLDKGYVSQIAFLPDNGANKIESGGRGVWQIKIKSQGKSAHASRLHQGKNAISQLINFLHELQNQVNINIGKIQGGKAVNQVPDKACAYLDFRFSDKKDLGKIKTIIKKYKIKITEIAKANSWKINTHIPEIKLWRKLNKRRIASQFSLGSSDARFFAEKNIPVLAIQPKGGNHHKHNEWIDLKDLERYYNTLKQWVIKL